VSCRPTIEWSVVTLKGDKLVCASPVVFKLGSYNKVAKLFL
jgi:hypothetical protein